MLGETDSGHRVTYVTAQLGRETHLEHVAIRRHHHQNRLWFLFQLSSESAT
jgi:hypothetical protein